MDENEYKQVYNSINELRCMFEKALCSQQCRCSQSHMFRLADRHGAACQSASAQQQCTILLDKLRKQTRFVFKINDIDGPLPHNKEIRVQNGGLMGLMKLVTGDDTIDAIEDVHLVITDAIEKYGSIEEVPYNLVMQSVMAYKARPKRRSKKG